MRRPSPSFIISVLALVVATSGTSYAVATIGSKDIRNDSIRSVDIKDATIRSKDVKDGTLRSRDYRDGSVKRKDLGAGVQRILGHDDSARWLLVNAAGEIEAQSGGFTVKAAYQTLENTAPAPGDNSLRAAGNVYIDAGEDLTGAGIVATIALTNQVDQNGDGVTNGRAPAPLIYSGGLDTNPEFSGEISATTCGLEGIVACAPAGTNNTNHFVVSPRLSDGTVTTDETRKRFYVVIAGG